MNALEKSDTFRMNKASPWDCYYLTHTASFCNTIVSKVMVPRFNQFVSHTMTRIERQIIVTAYFQKTGCSGV